MKKLSLLLILLATSVCYAQDTISNHIDANNTRDTRYSVTYDFENGTMNPWTVIDADGDGYCWLLASEEISNAYGHNGSGDFVLSASYKNNVGALYPDNYLVSPQIQLGGYISFWACAQDNAWASEHFGVAISTSSNTNPNSFTTIQEWTMAAKSNGNSSNPTRDGNRTQGTWYHYFVDLSCYAGQTGYVAIRHFNCHDWYYLDVDDITISQLYDFEDGTLQGWTVSSSDNGSTTWTVGQNGYNPSGSSNYVYTTHNGNYYVGSVYDVSNAVDDWLISPRFMLGGNMSFYIKSTNATNYSDYYSVYLSTGTNNINQFTTTLVPSTQVNSTDYTLVSIDLSNYSGLGYVAIRHTAVADQASLLVDDISFSACSYGLPWNLMATFNAVEGGQYGVAYDGNNFYTSNWGYSGATHNFYKYDLNGNMLEGFEIAGCGTLRGMSYDGQYFYGVANSSTVYCVNLANHSLVSTFTSSYGAMRGITYDPVRDGFWVIGNWSGNLTLINRSGAIQQIGPALESASDLAYYKDVNDVEHVFYFNNADNGVYDYNITTNTLGGSVFNFSNTPGFDGGTSGGCTVGSFNGKIAFIGDIQQSPNLIGVYELSDIYYNITATANPSYGGTISGTNTYVQGSICTLQATPNSNYSFFSWTENGTLVSTNPTYSFYVTENRNLVANFVPAGGNKCALVFDLYDSYGDGWNNAKLNVAFNNGLPTQHITMFSGSFASYELEVNDGTVVTLTWTPGTWDSECSFNVHYEDGTMIYQGSNLNSSFSHSFQMDCPGSTTNYTISVSANPSNGGTVTGGGIYSQGQSCTVSATDNSGFTFNNWTENGSVVSTQSSYTFTVNNNRTLVANFQSQPQSYAISVSANPTNGGTVTGGGTYQQGQSCNVTAESNIGYTFTNWTENGNVVSTQASYTFTVTGNRTLVANFTQQQFTINVTANPTNGGTVTGGGTYTYGQSCSVTATPNPNFNFINWTENGNPVSIQLSYTFTVTSNRNLVANFTTQNYIINANAYPSDGGTISGAGGYDYGQTCILTATPATGYEFINWIKDGSQVSTETSYSFTVTESALYEAHFQLQSFTINASANPEDGGSVTGGGSYYYGQTCYLEATPVSDCTFINWTKGGEFVSNQLSYSFTVTENASYDANFDKILFEITATADPINGGDVSGAGTYSYGDTCILTATARTGFVFENWTRNDIVVSTSPSYPFQVRRNADYVAHFTMDANHCIITAMADPYEGGTVSGDGTFELGNMCTLDAIPADGYEFVNWTLELDGSQVSTNASFSFPVTGDAVYVAHFVKKYTITANVEPIGAGSIIGTGTFKEGESCTLIATPNPTYSFEKWIENGEDVSTDNPYSFAIDRDLDLVAVFSQGLFYTITASAGANGTISPSEGDVLVEPGEDMTFTMIPNSGCEVKKVLVDGVDRGPIPSHTFRNVNEDHTIHVEFSGLGLDDNTTLDLKVFPNPANDKINIQCQNMKQVSIFNLLGVQIESKDVNDDHVVLSTDDLPQGTYILKVETNNGRVAYSRFVIEK